MYLNTKTMLNLLTTTLKAEQQKLDNLQDWLNTHTDHPDFILIAGDRNAQSVKVKAIQFKISQIEKGLPLLGEEIVVSESIALATNTNNGFKTIQ